MYPWKLLPTLLPASLAGLLITFTLPLPSLGQVESQIQRPADPAPTPVEKETAISELIGQLERSWTQSYEDFINHKIPPFNPIGENTPDSPQQLVETLTSPTNPAPSNPSRPRRATQLKNIQRILARYSRQTKQRTALVYIRPGKNFTTLIMVPPSGEAFVYLNHAATDRDITSMSREFLSALSSPRLSARQQYLASAQTLYQWLIQPLEAELAAQKIDTLMLCTGSGLRGIPFAALHTGTQFLVERYNLSLIPAFGLVQLQYVNLRNSQALAAGAASFENLNPLPGVPLELSLIQRLLPNSQVLLNPKFTVKNINTELEAKSFQVLHLATHGEFRPGDARDAFIQFWDTSLPLDQFPQLNLGSSRVQLLVLSACQTALGDRDAELGFAGLALYSGVPSAIGSLWSISDPGTVAFMNEFYWQLRVAPTRSAALRQAQIKMISGSLEFRFRDLFRSGSRTGLQLPTEFATQVPDNLSSPYYWSPFVLVGNPW